MKPFPALFLIAFTAFAGAAEYPAKPIRIITPFPPGGSVDLVARTLAADLSKPLGQQIVVDNRSGASGNIGTELAKNAPPDGYTLLLNTLPFVTSQFVYPQVPYDPLADFAPVAHVSAVAAVLVMHPTLPVSNLKQLIALARSKPNALTYATAGAATNSHMAGELMNNLAKVRLFAVHYKGSGPGIVATMSGETQLLFANAIREALPQIEAGRLKALGITATKRNAIAPQIPTIAESGLPGYEITTWHVLAAPRGTPAPVVTTLNETLRASLRAPEAVKRWQDRGVDVVASTPEEMTALLRKEIQKWRVVFREQGIKAE